MFAFLRLNVTDERACALAWPQVLAHFNVDTQSHALVFTSGATGALQLLGEMCPWATGATSSSSSSSSSSPSSSSSSPSTRRSQRGCELVLLDDNHTSALGLREAAIGGGAARVRVVDGALRHVAEIYSRHPNDSDFIGTSKEPALPMLSAPLSAAAAEAVNSSPSQNEQFAGLFVLPAESNFSGVRYDLDLVSRVQAGALGDIGKSSSIKSDTAFASASSLTEADLTSIRDHSNRGSIGGRWLVALDASKFAGTHALDLRRVRADFVTISFYKMFGHPTGLGALIVRRDALPTLALASGSPCSSAAGTSASDHGGSHIPAHSSSSYFGGGTVQVVDAHSRFHVARASLTDRFERGTPNTAAILALTHGFDALRRVGGMQTIAAHCAALTAYTARALQRLAHGNGRRACVLFGNHCTENSPVDNESNLNSDQCASTPAVSRQPPPPPPGSSGQGPVISFGLLRPDGVSPVGFAEVETLAAHAARARGGIHLRTGCLCNPGACQRHLALDGATVRRHWAAGRVCGDAKDVMDGRATGTWIFLYLCMRSFAIVNARVFWSLDGVTVCTCVAVYNCRLKFQNSIATCCVLF
jgi:molybdenum cofactor sulfurtransferase